ncbi:hypothetical protein ABE10_01395, partial [Bacillus toyonensis]|nr:hypothetical protein [Bacillus toyonensis]
AQDQREQDQQQRQVEAAEERGVPLREGGEQAGARDDHPGLVEVPDRADRVDHLTPRHVVLAEEGQRHPHAEVEAVEDEIPDEEERDDPEPEDCEVHVFPP